MQSCFLLLVVRLLEMGLRIVISSVFCQSMVSEEL